MQDRLAIPGDSDDARAVRTRDTLAWSLIALMREKAYDDINVQDICEHAQIGRSTFYSHFADKDELFVRHIVVFGEWLGGRLNWDPVAGTYRFDLRFMLEHVRDMRPVYDSLARSRKAELVTKVWLHNLTEGFEKCIAAARGGEPQALPVPVLARHIAGTIINLLTWWLDHGYPLDATRLDEQFHGMIKGLR